MSINIYDAIGSRRSIRKFYQEPLAPDKIIRIIGAARLAPQGANVQPMKYLPVTDKTLVSKIQPHIKWAMHCPEHAPKEHELPVAFICCLCDTELKPSGWDIDAGAAIATLILAATGEGIGTCWLGAIDRNNIKRVLHIADRFHLHSMVALGIAAEQPITEDENGSVKYYEDNNGILHVPKRRIEDIILDF